MSAFFIGNNLKNLTKIICVLLCLASCKADRKTKVAENQVPSFKKYHGKTMGTSYNITFQDPTKSVDQSIIDSALVAINLSLSTYIDSSTISKINQSDTYGEKITLLINSQYKTSDKITLKLDQHFITNFEKAEEIFRNSDGYFDPTIMPLVNYWGFGYDPKVPVTKVDSAKIKSLLSKVGLEKFNLEYNSKEMVVIKPSGASLDFSAIAKGYAVDQLAELLTDLGVKDMMVEIGGEAFAKGLSPKSRTWRVGLNTPKEDASLNDFSGIITLENKGLASSGNYRIFYEVNGNKYGHELNPKTGYPQKNELLGVSIVAPSCMEADAVATACMVMGYDLANQYITSYQQLEACFFIAGDSGNIDAIPTQGFSAFLID